MNADTYLRNSPLCVWQREKLARTPRQVEQRAKSLGLCLKAGESINKPTYKVTSSLNNNELFSGDFDGVASFIYNYNSH